MLTTSSVRSFPAMTSGVFHDELIPPARHTSAPLSLSSATSEPLSTLAYYYIGAAPFVLGLLFFWSDMSRGAFAGARLGPEVAGLAGPCSRSSCCFQVSFVSRLAVRSKR